ncbi:MAG: radical SAM protein [Firmicutes bacterium]|nr:radical SAM protein [Bacillota bacterium]
MDTRADLEAAVAEAEAAGILPLTSTCNLRCVFCSNRANPPGLRVHFLPPRPLDELRASVGRLARRRRPPEAVVIGESASRVCEGEPLTHPDFDEVARLVRRSLPGCVLRLTTNGTLLDSRRARLLAALAPVEVTLSLNTASRRAYRTLHGVDHDPRLPVRLLAEAGLPWTASAVAVPALTGRGDLPATARFVAAYGARLLRVFVPGHTSRTPAEVRALLPSAEEVAALVEEVRAAAPGLPVTLEPPLLSNLEPRLVGVLPGSPAARAGLGPGDVLTHVEGEIPFSRVDAFRRCLEALRRAGRARLGVAGRGDVVLEAPGGEVSSPGLVLDRDVDPEDILVVGRLARRLGAARSTVLTSTLAAPVLEAAFRAAGRLPGGEAFPPTRVLTAPSKTFGGSIGCAGLLTVADLAAALRSHPPQPGEAVFVPPPAFDRVGLDLLGVPAGRLKPLLPDRTRLVVPGLAVL